MLRVQEDLSETASGVELGDAARGKYLGMYFLL